jgi:FkbM family methyltransferase
MSKMPALKAILARIRKLQRKDRDRFLSDISGLIHVGANTGQERYLYAAYGLRVLWIEPIPEIFYKLVANIKAFPGQRAVEDLVTDRDGEEYTFHISNNSGLSSSILALKQHKDIWPDVDYTESIPLTSTTLNSLLQREQIDPAEYQALIMDTQGLLPACRHQCIHDRAWLQRVIPPHVRKSDRGWQLLRYYLRQMIILHSTRGVPIHRTIRHNSGTFCYPSTR